MCDLWVELWVQTCCTSSDSVIKELLVKMGVSGQCVEEMEKSINVIKSLHLIFLFNFKTEILLG